MVVHIAQEPSHVPDRVIALSDLPDPPPSFRIRMMIIAAIGGLVATGLLGVIVIQQFRAVQLRDARDIGSAYIQGFLTPYAQEAHDTGRLSDISALDLMRIVGTFSTARHFEALRIRAPDGSIIFSSDAANVVLAESPDDFLRARGGAGRGGAGRGGAGRGGAGRGGCGRIALAGQCRP
jgi:hypothetical protein